MVQNVDILDFVAVDSILVIVLCMVLTFATTLMLLRSLEYDAGVDGLRAAAV